MSHPRVTEERVCHRIRTEGLERGSRGCDRCSVPVASTWTQCNADRCSLSRFRARLTSHPRTPSLFTSGDSKRLADAIASDSSGENLSPFSSAMSLQATEKKRDSCFFSQSESLRVESGRGGSHGESNDLFPRQSRARQLGDLPAQARACFSPGAGGHSGRERPP